jgi:hypothetical protein
MSLIYSGTRRAFAHWLELCLSLVLAALAPACASTGPSVRAVRMYKHEQPTPRLLRLHIEQMKRSLYLINTLLSGTPYQPGARWVLELPLDDAKAEQARRLLDDAADRASFVAVYATHLAEVIKQTGAAVVPPAASAAAANVVPVHPSILDALSTVHPGLAGQEAGAEQRLTAALAAANRERVALATADNPEPDAVARTEAKQAELTAAIGRLRAQIGRPPSAADLADPLHAQIVSDAITITSVALRLSQEAISLAMVVYLEASSLTPSQWFKGAPDSVELAAELPGDARDIYRGLVAAAQNLKALFERLKALEDVKLADTLAYRYKAGLVDDIVGLAWDSVHLDAQGGAEAVFYSAIDDTKTHTGGSGDTYDYSGRQTELKYHVEPIVLASFRLTTKVDLPHWVEALGLNLGYATNRIYKSGGTIEDGSFASALGVKNVFSDALDAALAVAGVHASVRYAHFTHGTVDDVLVADGSTIASAPLTLDMTQADLGYDLAPRNGQLVQQLTLGFRYFDYSLPRIVYQLENATPGAEQANYVYSLETPPQRMRTRYYMGALTGRFNRTFLGQLTPYLNLDFAAGYGPTHYYLLVDPDGLDVPENQQRTNSYSVGIGFAGALGLRWQIGGPEARLNAYLDVNYHFQTISSAFQPKKDDDTVVSIGQTDVFHGPRASFGATF